MDDVLRNEVDPVAKAVGDRWNSLFADRPHLWFDLDGEWVWPCRGHSCLSEAVPVEIHDHPGEIEIAADVMLGDSGLDVVFTRLRILGETPRAAEWRSLVEELRGHHPL